MFRALYYCLFSTIIMNLNNTRTKIITFFMYCSFRIESGQALVEWSHDSSDAWLSFTVPHVHTYHPETQKIAHFILDVLSFAPIKTTLPFGNLCNGKVEGAGPDSAFRVCGKKGRIPVKVRSQHINVDNCRYLHIRKSENPDFH